MIKKLLFPVLKIAYLGVVVNGKKVHIHTKHIMNDRLIKEEKREFEYINNKPSQTMIEYLERVDRTTTYFYTAIALNSINQGAVPSVDLDFFAKLGIDTENIQTISKSNDWSIYGSKYDIEAIQKTYDQVDGVDFIFPTESIIDFVKEKEKIAADETTAFLLYDLNNIALTIYHKNILVYSSHFVFDDEETILSSEETSDVSDLLDDVLGGNDILEEIVELDNINDDFDSIEDLNDFVATDGELGFGDSTNFDSLDTQEKSADSYSFLDEETQGDLRKDLELLNFVKSSINDFYKNENLESSFVSKVVILDSHDAAKGVARFIKEELYIDNMIVDIDIAKTVCDMAISEVGK